MEVCISFPGCADGFVASDSSCLYKLFKNSGTVKTSALSAPIFYRHVHGQGFPFTSLNGMWPFAKTLKHSPNLCTVNSEHKALSGAPLGGRGSPSWAGRWLFFPQILWQHWVCHHPGWTSESLAGWGTGGAALKGCCCRRGWLQAGLNHSICTDVKQLNQEVRYWWHFLHQHTH